jgi:hypothetical protein
MSWAATDVGAIDLNRRRHRALRGGLDPFRRFQAVLRTWRRDTGMVRHPDQAPEGMCPLATEKPNGDAHHSRSSCNGCRPDFGRGRRRSRARGWRADEAPGRDMLFLTSQHTGDARGLVVPRLRATAPERACPGQGLGGAMSQIARRDFITLAWRGNCCS